MEKKEKEVFLDEWEAVKKPVFFSKFQVFKIYFDIIKHLFKKNK
jgi:hypothetical protein